MPLSTRYLFPSQFAIPGAFVVALAFAVVLAPQLHATAIATGSISVTNFTMTPSSSTVAFGGPWTAQAFTQAQNSLCGCDSQFDSSVGGAAQADAMVQFAQAHSTADAAALNLSASASVNIPGGLMAANATGQATIFSTTFSITGGTGPVDVTFSAMLDLTQSLFTDASGTSAGEDASYSLSLDGQTVLFMNSFNQVGPSSSWSNSFSGSLSNTITLNFDQSYTLYGSVDTEPSGGSIPEPPSGSLLMLGAAIPLVRRCLMEVRAR